jgi:hypothetical protein
MPAASPACGPPSRGNTGFGERNPCGYEAARVRTALGCCCLVLLAVARLATAAGAPDSAFWFARFEEHLDRFYERRGFLGWDHRAHDRIANDQADLMEALLYAYRSTGDPRWLDEFALQADAVVAKVGDLDGDGHRGWDTPRYAHNLVSNPSFSGLDVIDRELVGAWDFAVPGDDPTLPRGWHRSQSTSNEVFRAVVDDLAGGYAVTARTDGINWVGLEHTTTSWLTDAVYQVVIAARSDTPSVQPNIDVRIGGVFLDVARSVSDLAAAPGWGQVSVTFRTPASPGLMSVRLLPTSVAAGATLRFHSPQLFRATEVSAAAWRPLSGTAPVVELGPGYATIVQRTEGVPAGAALTLTNPYVQGGCGYQPGIRYRVRGELRAEHDGTEGILRIYDATTATTLGESRSATRDWQWREFEFDAPADCAHDLQVHAVANGGGSGPRSVSFRNLRVQQFAGYIVDEALVLNVLLRFALLVQTDPALSRWRDKADAYYQLATELAGRWQQDWFEAQQSGAFLARNDGSLGSQARATLPVNQFMMAGLVMLRLDAYRPEPELRRRAAQIARTFMSMLHHEADVAWWYSYQEPFADAGRNLAAIASSVEDTSHGNLVAAFVLESYRRGIVFDEATLAPLVNLFTHRMFNRDWARPRIADVITGGDGAGASRLPLVWWWLEAAELDPEVLEIVTACAQPFVGIDTSTPIHSELGVWYDQGWRVLLKAMLAYYHKQRETGQLGPRLSIKRHQHEVRLRWPAWLEDFQLEASEGVAIPSPAWLNVPGAGLEPGFNVVSLPGLEAQRFFRLQRRKPAEF